jgi:hypothetical protein
VKWTPETRGDPCGRKGRLCWLVDKDKELESNSIKANIPGDSIEWQILPFKFADLRFKPAIEVWDTDGEIYQYFLFNDSQLVERCSLPWVYRSIISDDDNFVF